LYSHGDGGVPARSLSASHPPSPALQHTFSSFVPIDQSLFSSELPHHLCLWSAVGLKSPSAGAENWQYTS